MWTAKRLFPRGAAPSNSWKQFKANQRCVKSATRIIAIKAVFANSAGATHGCNRYRFGLISPWRCKQTAQGPNGDPSTEQGTDWVRVFTKDECESFTKIRKGIFKCPACRFLLFIVLKTERLMKPWVNKELQTVAVVCVCVYPYCKEEYRERLRPPQLLSLISSRSVRSFAWVCLERWKLRSQVIRFKHHRPRAEIYGYLELIEASGVAVN